MRAYHETYRLPVLLTNCSNNYGPFQFPEKLIPLMILNAVEGKKLPIYGDGGNVRDWLYVEDHCEGILLVLRKGAPGAKYNIGGGNERTNLQVVDALCASLDAELPAAKNPALAAAGLRSYSELKTFVPDRPGHDRRYAIDASKIRAELGWSPRHAFEAGLRETVRWYLANKPWCEAVQSGKYRRERLGLTHEIPPDRPARRHPDRAGRLQGRARLLPRDLPREEVRRGRDPGAVRAGQPLVLGARHAARAARAAASGRRASWCARSRARCSTWRSTSAAARPRSENGSASCSRATTSASSGSRPASPTASACTSERVHVEYKCTGFYEKADEIAIAWNDPAIGIDWPIATPTLSAKDGAAPRLAEILEQLPAQAG